jgi:ADP-ribosylglycohydrolase
MSSPAAIRATALGLAAGDALSWTAPVHREYLLPARRMPRLRMLDTYADGLRSTTRPHPHVHSSPVRTLTPRPADDLEWFAFAALAQLRERREPGGLRAAWRELADAAGELRARTGTFAALENLRSGLEPPQSGHDNAHYFDDIACVRAVAAGLLASDAGEAARLAEADAEVTHSLDGVWCARATAVLVERLAGGAAVEDAIAAALEELPAGRWSRASADRALEIAAASSSALDLAMRLDTQLTDHIYSYAVSAPETLALLLAHLARSESATELMLGAFAHGRNADALPALAGAVAGARFGEEWVPEALRRQPVLLDGVCVPALAGSSLGEVIDGLSGAAPA